MPDQPQYRESAPVKQCVDGVWRQLWPRPNKPYPPGVQDGFRYVTEWVPDA